MMISYFLTIIMAIMLYNIFNGVNSAGLSSAKTVPRTILTEEGSNTPVTQVELPNSLDYKFQALMQIINKMDNSIQNLQEKSHTWAIFHHHINSWNDGIRVLENKLDLLKRIHEEQQLKLQNLELAINNNLDIKNLLEILNDIKQFLTAERKVKNDISPNINNILKLIQGTSGNNNEIKPNKIANIMGPIGRPSSLSLCSNISRKIEQGLNTISLQMAQQKDLKQLNSLEKRNSKSLESVNQILTHQLDKQDEIITRLQKSNECCYSLSSELTTFTESSDILLKRIEKLVRNVSEKLNDIDITSNNNVHDHDDNNIDNENGVEGNNDEKFVTEDEDFDGEIEFEDEIISSNENDDKIGITGSAMPEYDEIQDVEFVRPNLNGCHELLDGTTTVESVQDDSTHIDGIYKFSTPDINEAERDFNERYCVFPHSPNDTGLPWTVIQRRGPYQQQENFNRSWSEYRNGFGNLSRDFWFGNEFIHRLVYHDDYELLIELEDFNGTRKWAGYSVFRVDSEKYNYNLLIGDYRGTLKDAMKYHNDNDFSTYDRRNDKTIDACCSCAMGYASGWWFDNCSEANLNGVYHYDPLGHNYIGIMWELWHGDYSLKKTRMMIRPRYLNTNLTTKHYENYNEHTEDP